MNLGMNQRPTNILMLRLVALLKAHMQNIDNDKLLTYKEAEKLTTLSEDTLKRLIDERQFVEGRHYIKVGSRVAFSPALPALMFEDKLSASKIEQNTGTHQHRKSVAKAPASPPKKRKSFGGTNPADLSYTGRAER